MRGSGRSTILLALVLILGVAAVALGAVAFRFWAENQELAARPSLPPVVYRSASNDRSFLDGAASAAGVDQAALASAKRALTESGERFVEVDLKMMTLSLYEQGRLTKSYPVLTKGRDGSWWETPTGRYEVLGKEANHFSSIGHVWMPWSIQFYGNFFIHGWPTNPDGTAVQRGYSGGCVRLSTDDAREVFEFVSRGMPILVSEEEEHPAFYRELTAKRSDVPPPQVAAAAAFATDLASGETLLGKNVDDRLPIASLTKLMTGVVASELVYLERSVTITTAMLSAAVQSQPLEPGERYRAFDLLYPLLESSSNGAASALAAFLGERRFVTQMNTKATSLGMADTTFVDPSGIGDGNVSTLRDLAKLVRYLVEKRRFLFDIGRGKNYLGFSSDVFIGVANLNEFHDDARLVGMKNGETVAAGQTVVTVWNLTPGGGEPRTIMVGLLGSSDRVRDTEAILNWLRDTFGLQ